MSGDSHVFRTPHQSAVLTASPLGEAQEDLRWIGIIYLPDTGHSPDRAQI